jgi:exopolysaccharide production protein ExoZ
MKDANGPTGQLQLPQVFAGVQYLRFVAALLVVLVHAFEMVPLVGNGDLGANFWFGSTGVDIFFVISGFIMVVITERRERAPFDFFAHRLIRVAPSYWIVTIAIAAIALFTPSVLNNTTFSLPHFLASLSFVAWPHPVKGEALPLLMIGWTLNYEFLFYSIFAVAILCSVRHRIWIAGAALLGLVLLGQVTAPEGPESIFYTRPILIEFIFGLLVGKLAVNRWVPGYWVSVAMVAIGTVAFAYIATFVLVLRVSDLRFLILGFPALLLVAGTVFLEMRKPLPRWRLLLLLGNASYALYLTHFFVIGLLRMAWEHWSVAASVPDIGLIATATLLSLVVGVLFHLWIERPITGFLGAQYKRIRSRRKPVDAPVDVPSAG